MRTTDLWPTSARIIEIGATCDSLGRRLVAAGFGKYLAVAANERRRQVIAKQAPELRHNVVAARSGSAVRLNNADVMILGGWSAFAVARFRSVRHAQYVALKFELTPLCWLALLCSLMQCLTFRLAPPRLVNCGSKGNSGPWLLAFRVRRQRPYGSVRRFVPHRLGVCGLLRELQRRDVRHAVLRWFETLPQLPAGEDLDLLVEDCALEEVRSLLEDGPGIQPVDLYSVTGLPGSDFRGMPYYPPYLADELLDRAVVHRGVCRVPASREHFLSLAYHALYHKGWESGIPSAKSARRRAEADHDYVDVLRRLAGGLDIGVPMTLEGLDEYLDSEGWRPPHDMLIRLSRRNRWVRSLLRQPEKSSNADDRIAVFLLREAGMHRGGVQRAAELIERHGFRILTTRTFDERASATIARSLRGGNWGRGPWPISGGPPVAAIVVYDPSPIAPSRRDRKRFPFIANARLLCKEELRDAFNEGFAKDRHCNVIHSSDNGREAMDYLRIIMPDGIDDVLSRVASSAVARAA